MDMRAPLYVEIAIELARVEREAFIRADAKFRAQFEGADYPTERERRALPRYGYAKAA